MPNWCWNAIEINCPIETLVIDGWLIKEVTNTWDEYIFNLHKLFPEVRGEWNGEEFEFLLWWADDAWYYWNIENLWTKWNPTFGYNNSSEDEWITILIGQSARSPPNALLRKFCELSWYYVENEYEEPWVWFEWTYTYDANGEMDDEREYIEYCEACWEKDPTVTCRNEDEYLCDECFKS